MNIRCILARVDCMGNRNSIHQSISRITPWHNVYCLTCPRYSVAGRCEEGLDISETPSTSGWLSGTPWRCMLSQANKHTSDCYRHRHLDLLVPQEQYQTLRAHRIHGRGAMRHTVIPTTTMAQHHCLTTTQYALHLSHNLKRYCCMSRL